MRTFDQERDSRAVYALIQDAFADNERHTAESFEEWQAFMIDREAFEPGLWFIAESKGEIVGCVLCPNYEDEGWIRQLAVSRDWRRRGLGTALFRQAMAEFSRRGRRELGLVVDSWNRTGAKELYERAGMTVAREHIRFEKTLARRRPGDVEPKLDVRRVGAEDAELPRQALDLGERLAHDLVERVPGQHRVEAVAPGRPRDGP